MWLSNLAGVLLGQRLRTEALSFTTEHLRGFRDFQTAHGQVETVVSSLRKLLVEPRAEPRVLTLSPLGDHLLTLRFPNDEWAAGAIDASRFIRYQLTPPDTSLDGALGFGYGEVPNLVKNNLKSSVAF